VDCISVSENCISKERCEGKLGVMIFESQRAKISFGERANPPQIRFRKRRKVQALTKGTSHAPGLVD